MSSAELYLDLLKKALTGLVGTETYSIVPRAGGELEPARLSPEERDLRVEGRDWPATGETMIGLKRLDNLHRCIVDVLRNQVPGDLIEAGVWRGGATIFMRGALKAYEVSDRQVWVADSFDGLPPPDVEQFPADAGGRHHENRFLAVPAGEVRENFARYDLLDDQVRFLEGWFRDTLPTVRDHTWALVRLDGDMYESTIQGLENLYPGLSTGGYVIVDDYASHMTCRRAVDDFWTAKGITEELRQIDWTGVYWQKSR